MIRPPSGHRLCPLIALDGLSHADAPAHKAWPVPFAARQALVQRLWTELHSVQCIASEAARCAPHSTGLTEASCQREQDFLKLSSAGSSPRWWWQACQSGGAWPSMGQTQSGQGGFPGQPDQGGEKKEVCAALTAAHCWLYTTAAGAERWSRCRTSPRRSGSHLHPRRAWDAGRPSL